MKVGTIRRSRDCSVRYGDLSPEPAFSDSGPSRRITVLRLWPGRRFNPRILV